MIDVVIIAGYLGAGKTTLINRLLSQLDKPVGVLVNDFGALNVDAQLIAQHNGVTLELNNGCVCCQIGDDLGAALDQLKRTAPTTLTSVYIEASGVALPDRVARYPRSWPGFSHAGTYTIIDTNDILRLQRDKFVSQLVQDQIEQCDVLLSNKAKVVPAGVERLIKASGKRHFNLDSCDLRLTDVVHPQPLEPRNHIAMSRQPENTHQHTSLVWKPKQPLTHQQLEDVLQANPQVVRAKGWFTDPNAQQWLVQATKQNLQTSPTSVNAENALVFIYTGSIAPDLSYLQNNLVSKT